MEEKESKYCVILVEASLIRSKILSKYLQTLPTVP